MIYGYIRVSSDKQTVENQRYEIEKFCKDNYIQINGWIEETISGMSSYKKRRLGKLLRTVKSGDIIICSELSRLGRSIFMVMEILGKCMQRNVRIWTTKDGYRLGDDIQSKVLAFAFALSAEIERNLISQRTKEALARKRAEGQHLGRPFGSRSNKEKYTLHTREAFIREELNNGVSLTKLARKLNCTRTTLCRYIDTFMNSSPTSAE